MTLFVRCCVRVHVLRFYVCMSGYVEFEAKDETKETAIRIDFANRHAGEKHITMEDETLKEGGITEYVNKARTRTKQKVVLIPWYARKLGDIKQDMKKRCSIPLKPSEKIIRMVESQKEQKALEAVRKMRKEMRSQSSGCYLTCAVDT